MGFAIIGREAVEGASGNAHSLSLDLFDQWRGFENNRQWRFAAVTAVRDTMADRGVQSGAPFHAEEAAG